MTFGDIHTHHSGFDIKVSSIYINVNTIQPNQINIQFFTGTSTAQISGGGFSMNGGAHIKVKFHFIHKSCSATISVSGASFQVKYSLLTSNSRLNVRIDSVHIGTGSVHIHLHGDIITKILDFLVNLLKHYIVKELVHQMQKKIPDEMTKMINKILNGLPQDIDIPHSQLAVKYQFPYAPNYKNDYMYVGIYSYIYYKKNPQHPTHDPNDIPEYDPKLPKGIQFFFSEFEF